MDKREAMRSILRRRANRAVADVEAEKAPDARRKAIGAFDCTSLHTNVAILRLGRFVDPDRFLSTLAFHALGSTSFCNILETRTPRRRVDEGAS